MDMCVYVYATIMCNVIKFYLLCSRNRLKFFDVCLFQCITRGYRNVLVDAGLTSCGKIVIVNRLTLEKAGLSGSIAVHTLDTLKKINIAELHPMG